MATSGSLTTYKVDKMKTFKLEVEDHELQYIGKLLRRCPFEEVAPLIMKLESQLVAQEEQSKSVPNVTSNVTADVNSK